MLRLFGASLLILTLLTGCSGSGGGGGGGGGGGNNGALGTNANLSDLTLSTGSLDQVFQAFQTIYTATFGFLGAATTVTPTTQDANATVTVNGAVVISGTASGLISLNEGANTITVTVTAEDGVTTKTYTIDVKRQLANSFAQLAYLKASNADPDDQFGFSGALSGDTLAVGAVGEAGDNNLKPAAGAVYVFTSNNTQQALLRAVNADPGDQFGFSVSLSGDTLVVGAVGEAGDNNLEANAGAVYVFTRSNGIWTQQAYLKAANADSGDQFGFSVALSEDTLVVGAVGEAGANNLEPDAGAVYVFTRSNGIWTQQALLRASNADAGDQFGVVALSGNTLVVGAVGEAGANNLELDAGAVYVYIRNNGIWTQQVLLRASNADAGDLFGLVELSGDTLAVGAIGEAGDNNLEPNAGAGYLFR